MTFGVRSPGFGVETVAVLQAHHPYSLHRTLTCGQAFRWRVDGDVARGTFAGKAVLLRQRGDALDVDGLRTPEELKALAGYLSLDQPLARVEDSLRDDRVLRRILPQTAGIALIRQDPWECLISFVISAFNNIPKIEMTLDRLCRRFGEPLNGAAWRFPGPDRLASATLPELKSCLLGYRAPYLRAIARRVAAGRFDPRGPTALPYDDARVVLLDLPGVGEKVADCVLLFAHGKTEAFPVDVWVKRAVERWYFGGETRTEREIRAFARARFGALAGYAQQHLFYYIRKRGNTETRKRGPATV